MFLLYDFFYSSHVCWSGVVIIRNKHFIWNFEKILSITRKESVRIEAFIICISFICLKINIP